MRNLLNRLGNVFIIPLLKSPLHGSLSSQIMLITFTGRRTGKTYTTPVEYRREGDTILVSSFKDRRWWKNLQGGAPVRLRVRGQDLPGVAQVFTQDMRNFEPALRAMYPRMSPQLIERLAPHKVMIWIELRQQD